MLSKLTLIGLNNYTEGAIWANLELPEGINKELLINEIIKKGGEFCTLYPDPDFLKVQIQLWSKKWYHNFDRWVRAYNFEYEALYNLDVKSTITEEGENHDLGSKSSSDSRSISGSSSSSSNGSNSNEHKKAAYDSSYPVPTEKDDGYNSLSTSGNTTESNIGSGKEDTKNDATHKIVTEEYRRGNQGITMSQEMLLAEMNAWYWNLYDHIADIFVNEFCVCLYM